MSYFQPLQSNSIKNNRNLRFHRPQKARRTKDFNARLKANRTALNWAFYFFPVLVEHFIIWKLKTVTKFFAFLFICFASLTSIPSSLSINVHRQLHDLSFLYSGILVSLSISRFLAFQKQSVVDGQFKQKTSVREGGTRGASGECCFMRYDSTASIVYDSRQPDSLSLAVFMKCCCLPLITLLSTTV